MPIPMTFSVVRWFIPAQTSTGLIPAVNYLCKFYQAGTDTPKAIYDVDGNVFPSPSNVAILNGEGYIALKLGVGTYKLRICLPESSPSPTGGSAVYTEDNISGVGTFGTGFVDNIAALALLDTNANPWTFVGGYWDKGDGGHGMFWNATSSTAADGGYVIASTFDPTKRWFRVPDESGDVRAASYGYVGTKSGNLGANLLAAASYANSNGMRLVIGRGNAATVGSSATYTLTTNEIYFEDGSTLTNTSGTTTIVITAKCIFDRGARYAGTASVQFTLPQVFDSPDWFGATNVGTSGTIAANNVIAFGKWFTAAQAQSFFIVPPGDWYYTDTTSFPYPSTSPVSFQGRIVHFSAGSDIQTGLYYTSNSRFRIHRILFDEGLIIDSAGSNHIAITGDISLVGDANFSNNLTVTNGITGNSITGTSQVIGGTVYGGGRAGFPIFIGTLGEGVQQYAPGGIFSAFQGDMNVFTTTKYSFSLKAKSLMYNLQAIKFTIFGRWNANAKYVKIDLNGVSVLSNTTTGVVSGSTSGKTFLITAYLVRVSSTTCLFYGSNLQSGGTLIPDLVGDPTTVITGLNFAADQSLDIYSTGATGETHLNSVMYEYITTSPQ